MFIIGRFFVEISTFKEGITALLLAILVDYRAVFSFVEKHENIIKKRHLS